MANIGFLAKKSRNRNLSQSLVSDREVYWREQGGQRDGPYCKTCWHSTAKLVQLTCTGATGLYDCPLCGCGYHSGEYKPDSGSISFGRYGDAQVELLD